jgi:hypothetical protein
MGRAVYDKWKEAGLLQSEAPLRSTITAGTAVAACPHRIRGQLVVDVVMKDRTVTEGAVHLATKFLIADGMGDKILICREYTAKTHRRQDFGHCQATRLPRHRLRGRGDR